MKSVDIVIPVRNEESNVEKVAKLLDENLKKVANEYKLIFVIDPSTDKTAEVLTSLANKYPIIIHYKQGIPGKGYSLIEGILLSTADLVGFIDGDLQYPADVIPTMVNMLEDQNLGVVVANRREYHSSLIRKLGSRINKFIFGKFLLGLDCDIQSGLKLFKREIFDYVDITTIGPWTFDMPLLHTATQLGYQIGSVEIDYLERTGGVSKVKFFKTAVSIASCAVRISLKEHKVYHLNNTPQPVQQTIIFKKHQFNPHTMLPHHKSALYTTMRGQKVAIATILLGLVLLLVETPLKAAIFLTAILSFIYFSDVLFSIYLILKSLHFPPELRFSDEEINAIKDEDLPIYSVLCPLYKEAQVLPQFVNAMEKMDYPKEKMDILILLEENDKETIEVANNMNLPAHYRVVVVPHSMPKTKPKACNYGIQLAKGEFMVVYDAEDIPETTQLKKGYLAFNKVSKKVICIQAKLNYYNPHQNLLTTLFTAEYSLWFDVILPGLQSINTIIPLGGTSNHFRTKELTHLHAWDPFNVTEDCDLGVRLFKDGYKTEIMDSITLEEANSDTKNWIRQRSRWIKGYLQTYLVHMRDPIEFVKRHKWHALVFQLIIGLRISFILINPFLWATTIAYFTLYKYVGPTIESLYPTPVFYMAAFALVFGNFIYLYNYMIGLAKRGHWDIIKYVFVVPFYWAMMGISAVIAFQQLIFKPHFWEKTHHGLHMAKKQNAAPVKNVKPIKVKKILGFDLTSIKFNENFKKAFKFGLSGSSVLVIAGVLANILSYLFNAYLSRKVELDDFGLIALFGSLVFLTSIPLSALTRTITHKAAYYFGKHNEPVYNFWKKTRHKTFIYSVVVTAIWILLIPWMKNFFNAEDYFPFIIFTPVIIINALTSVDIGFLSGNLAFYMLATLLIIENLTKLILSVFFVSLGLKEIVYISIPISLFLAYIVGYVYSLKFKPQNNNNSSDSEVSFSKKFFISSMLAKFSIVSYISFDVILAQHYLTPDNAGRYALISLVGKMIFFVGTLFAQFIIPVISHNEGANKNSENTFTKIILITSVASLGVYLLVGMFGKYTTPFLLGEKVNSITYLLPIYGFGMLCYTLASSIISFHQVKNRHLYTGASFILAIIQIVAFELKHDSLHTVVNIMAVIGILNLAITVIMHVFWQSFVTLEINITDFIGAFFRLPQKDSINASSLNVLIYNWRDTKHIWAGGAEVYVHEIAKRLVRDGHKVTLFCGNDRKNPRYEEIDGVQIVRRGGFYTVYIWAVVYYLTQFRGKYDIIVDSENGIPFFTPLFVRKPILGLIHHVHQEIILKELHLAPIQLPFALMAKILESKIMPLVYANVKMITVSSSSKRDMEKIKLGIKKHIDIINPGIEPSRFGPMDKTTYPSILYLGRLKAYKRIETLIYAMKHVLKEHPTAKLRIAGFGDHRPYLEKVATNLRIENSVEFLGKVSEETKQQLYGESWVFCYPSSMEGWGISIIEANACGTAVVASKVPGLIDSVNHLKTGFLVKLGSEKEFAKKINLLIKDENKRKEMETNALKWAQKHTWDSSTEQMLASAREAILSTPNVALEYKEAKNYGTN